MFLGVNLLSREGYSQAGDRMKAVRKKNPERNITRNKDKPNMDKEKKKIIILWEVNSFPTIEIKSGKDHEEDV